MLWSVKNLNLILSTESFWSPRAELVDCNWDIWTVISHEGFGLPRDTCITPGRKCHRKAYSACDQPSSHALSSSLTQLPPPAPPWKPPLTGQSLDQSILSDTRSISLALRVTIWWVLLHGFAGTTAPGPVSAQSAKVSCGLLRKSQSSWICKSSTVLLNKGKTWQSVWRRQIKTFETLERWTKCTHPWGMWTGRG